jgi:hypothetical protein
MSIFEPDLFSLFPWSIVVDDFNKDGLVDLTFFSQKYNRMYMLPGYGNGTFGISIESYMEYVDLLSSMTVGDFNRDNQLNVAFTDENANYMGVLLGNVNGTFGDAMRFSTGSNSRPVGITAADLNGDSYFDIAVANEGSDNVGVFLGNGGGNFSTQIMVPTGYHTEPRSIVINDFNGDNYLDITVVNSLDRNIGIFLGHGDGTFDIQNMFFTGGRFKPTHIAVGDFNSDTRQDIVFSYIAKRIGVMFGYGNGTFDEKIKFTTESTWTGHPVAVVDLNRDGHLDVVVGQNRPYSIRVLLGDGNGNFGMQTIFSTDLPGYHTQIGVGDFNGDRYQDIIALNSVSGNMNLLLNPSTCSL